MRLYSRIGLIVSFVGAVALSGCTHYHTNMLTSSIKTFASKIQVANEKVWVTSMADNTCDKGCQSPLTCNGNGGGVKLGGLFGASRDGSSSYDRLAYEVISNYLTQAKKMRVVETHRHNYSTDLKVETRKKIDVVVEKNVATGMSCEDLCLLDEAKKRNSDKVLAYRIIRMEDSKLTIHYRLSDVKTGVVEASHTIAVAHPNATDTSFVEPAN